MNIELLKKNLCREFHRVVSTI